MALPHVHVITPGDHFSPRTGSAIPTVVHGLATAGRATGETTRVVVARGTYPDRYDSAEILEYTERPPRRSDRYVDAATSRVGLGRPRARRRYAATMADQASWEPSVVFAHNAPQLIGAIDAHRHVPVLYAHNELLRTYSPREAGRALENASRIICVSEFLAGRTRDRLPPSLRDRVAVVRNGVDTDFFRPPDVHEPHTGLRVAFVGRMIPDKGADVLVEALRRLDRDDINVTIVGAVGFDPNSELTSFERKVRHAAAPLGERARLLPFRPRTEVARFLRDADVAVVPSRWPDPCPLTVLEAMASGAVTIASDIGGIPEIVGPAGILVPPDDVEALSAALADLASCTQEEISVRKREALTYAASCSWSTTLPTLVEAVDEAQLPTG